MAVILPFRALRYNAETVGNLERVVTQPYDKISPEMQARYYDLNPNNLVRIIRGHTRPEDTREESVYVRAARDLRDWIANGVLVPQSETAIYPYFQEYNAPGQVGVRKLRRGFIALLRLEDYSARVVHRHEKHFLVPRLNAWTC